MRFSLDTFRLVFRPSVARPVAVIAATGGVLALAAAGAAAAVGGPDADLLKVRVGGDAHQTRVVIELDKAASSKLIAPNGDASAASEHVTIAMPHVGTAGDMQGQGEGLVKSWSIDSAAGAARLKFELRRPAVVKRRFLLPPGDGLNVYRYVIDLSTDDIVKAETSTSQPAKDGAAPDTATAELGEDDGKATKAAYAVAAPLRSTAKKVVVIDAGHGGKDSGALGSHTKEKDDTLAAAHALRDRLERTGRYKVVMTRDADAYIPLETRVQIARRADADLFISLHADSIGVVGAATRGASVYTLSERGADRTARGLFGKSDWFMNVNLPGQDSATKRILLDLTQRQNVNRSSTFAEILLDKEGQVTPLLRRSHRDANLMVLLAPDVPAVLMEMGFITNPDDEEALASPEHRGKMMDAAAAAIDAYFAEEAKYAMR
jgi:N-acetylmuramoyl-L-alanine amidase